MLEVLSCNSACVLNATSVVVAYLYLVESLLSLSGVLMFSFRLSRRSGCLIHNGIRVSRVSVMVSVRDSVK